jgi:hypothetical protein
MFAENDYSILPGNFYQTGTLPDDLKAGYDVAANIVDAVFGLSKEFLARFPKRRLDDYCIRALHVLLRVGEPETVNPALLANTREINSVRDHPVTYWGIVAPNAHLVCFELWARLGNQAWRLARLLGMPALYDFYHGLEAFDFSVFNGQGKAIRDHFIKLALPSTRHLMAELQLEVSKAAQRRRDFPGRAIPTTAPVILTDEDRTILTVLAKAGRALTYSKICMEASRIFIGQNGAAAREAGLKPVSETTVRNHVPILERLGLVKRPPGQDGSLSTRKGVGITDEGLACFNVKAEALANLSLTQR